MEIKNCKEIIKDYLISNGCDGLRCKSCGCFLNNLMPCIARDDYIVEECVPGKRSTIVDDYGVREFIVPDNPLSIDGYKIIGADRMIFDIFWRMFPGYTFDSIEQAYNIIIEKLEKDKLQKQAYNIIIEKLEKDKLQK